MILLAWLLKE
jgi:hypothetical protein